MTGFSRFGFFLVCCLLALASGAMAQDLKAGNDAYAKGKFEEAKVDYLHLIEKRQYTPDLFYNLGNAWFRLDDYGRAILNYHRALLLDHDFAEANANLKTTLKISGNNAPEKLTDKLERYADYFPVICSLGAWLLIFAVTLWFLSRRVYRRALSIIAFVGIVLLVGGASLFLWLGHGLKDPSRGVVVESMSDLKYGPAVSARTIETLRIGDPVKLISQRGEWTFCKADTGNIGWILTQKVEPLVP